MKGCYWIATILLLWLLTLLAASIALAQGDPTISNVSAGNITDTSAVITWTTDQLSDSTVNYGNTTPPVLTESDGTFTTDHAVTLIGLTSATLYYYEVISSNIGGNTTLDNNGGAYYTFTTPTVTPTPTPTPTDTTVDISPASQTVSALQEFTVDVVVAPAVPIAGVALNLSFDPSLLTANSVVEGDLLKQKGALTFFLPGIIDNVAGNITGVAGVILDVGQTVSSPGTFARITFTAKTTEGTSPLDLSNVIVGDALGAPVAIVVTGGSVTIEISVVSLSGWGWCTSHNKVVVATLEGHVAMVERAHAAQSYSLHVAGNLTLQLPNAPDETIELDMYGSRVRSLFYLRQEITGKSASFEGIWIDAGDGQYYISTTGMIALPNPEGEVLKTAKLCFVVLRTPEVDVPLTEPGSFVEDIDSMITRFAKFVDRLLDSLIGTGLREILNSILASIATLVAALRELGVPYIP